MRLDVVYDAFGLTAYSYPMGFFSRLTNSGDQRARKNETRDHLASFAASRKGCEVYFEEAGGREPSSILMVARDGEWTRRQVPSAKDAAKIATDLGLPFYEVLRTGYPQRMREWSARNK